MNNHTHRTIMLELHHLHYPLDRSAAVTVEPADNSPYANWAVGHLLKFHFRIPAGMVTDVFVSIELENLDQGPVEHLR